MTYLRTLVLGIRTEHPKNAGNSTDLDVSRHALSRQPIRISHLCRKFHTLRRTLVLSTYEI